MNMSPDFLRRIKTMQKELEAKQKDLEEKEFVIEKQGIKLTMKGDYSIVSLELDELLVDPDDIELLQDLLVVAFNEGIDLIKEETEKLAPAMPGMPF
ncbi:YbaB/EbfC family nucleoid-associated protein [Mycoplasma sp. 48589B]